MEGLTSSQSSSYYSRSDHYRLQDPRNRSPRLPTPEGSGSSNDAFDGRSPLETRPQLYDLSLHAKVYERSATSRLSNDIPHIRRDSRNMAIPQSPPYRRRETSKPSLPPLKTVLGENMSSPPRTPSPSKATPLQLSPREPSYTASTFKPPALYPDKRPRIDPFASSTPLYPGVNTLTSPFSPSVTLEPRPCSGSTITHVQFPPIAAPIDSIDSRRVSNTNTHSPSWSSRQHTQYPDATKSHLSNETPASYYQTPEQTPTTSMLEPSLPKVNSFSGPVRDPFAREMRESFSLPGDRPVSRRSSTSGYNVYPPRPFEREAPRPHPYQPSSRYSMPLRDGYADPRDSGRYGRAEDLPRTVGGFGQGQYPGNGTSFFMPSHYECQHGKARKRSNLPKQSTEIMKTWFDQNIGNPYPSEEQKAMFSSATGISMTQVSNWFINHRRRCPELRDKREKTRGGREMD